MVDRRTLLPIAQSCRDQLCDMLPLVGWKKILQRAYCAFVWNSAAIEDVQPMNMDEFYQCLKAKQLPMCWPTKQDDASENVDKDWVKQYDASENVDKDWVKQYDASENVFIHPFMDGNGRISRLLQDFVLMSLGYPPACIRVEQKQQYVAIQDKWKSGVMVQGSYLCDLELRPFVRFIFASLDRTMNEMMMVQPISEVDHPPAAADEVTAAHKMHTHGRRRLWGRLFSEALHALDPCLLQYRPMGAELAAECARVVKAAAASSDDGTGNGNSPNGIATLMKSVGLPAELLQYRPMSAELAAKCIAIAIVDRCRRAYDDAEDEEDFAGGRAYKTSPVALPKLKNLEKTASRKRKAERGGERVPKTLADINIPERIRRTRTAIPEDFVLADTGANDPQRLIILGSRTDLVRLASCATWLADGTFKSCPQQFYQLWTERQASLLFSLMSAAIY